MTDLVHALRAASSGLKDRGDMALARAEELDRQGDVRNASESGTAALVLVALSVVCNDVADSLEHRFRERHAALSTKFCIRCCESDIPAERTTCPACGSNLADKSKRKGADDAKA